MMNKNRLSDLVHSGKLSRTHQLLLCLADLGAGAHPNSEIRKVAESIGLSGANLARDMLKLKGMAFERKEGWELTGVGVEKANELLPSLDSYVEAQSKSLRKLLPRLKSDIQEFMTEAVACFEARHFRAAVVLSWVGAMSVLYGHVVQNYLAIFNAEATRRDPKWRPAKNEDDLSRMKEHEFLQVIESLSIIGKNVKGELESCLKLRNGCGHPNSLKLADSRCAAHIEVLILNVFDIFA